MRQVFMAARAARRPVSVCGEAAADARIACLLVGLGARELSMNPVSASRVRFAIRAVSQTQLQEIGDRALGCRSPREVSDLLDATLAEPLADILSGQPPPLEVA